MRYFTYFVTDCRLGFSILYANIPHCKTKSAMKKLINLCLNIGHKEIIGITRYGATSSNSQEKPRPCCNKTSLKIAINYLLDNSSLTLGSIFLSVGVWPNPFYGKLVFVTYHERKWPLQTNTGDMWKTHIFSNIF